MHCRFLLPRRIFFSLAAVNLQLNLGTETRGGKLNKHHPQSHQPNVLHKSCFVLPVKTRAMRESCNLFQLAVVLIFERATLVTSIIPGAFEHRARFVSTALRWRVPAAGAEWVSDSLGGVRGGSECVIVINKGGNVLIAASCFCQSLYRRQRESIVTPSCGGRQRCAQSAAHPSLQACFRKSRTTPLDT